MPNAALRAASLLASASASAFACAFACAFVFVSGCAPSAVGAVAHPRAAPSATLAAATATLQIVPQPRYARAGAGRFVWRSPVTIAAGAHAADAAALLRTFLREQHVTTRPATRGERADVTLTVSPASAPRLGPEGYALSVRRDGVELRGNSGAGLFYALQTLEQLSTASPAGLSTANATVVDGPQYRWRGIHLDVARHFFPVPVVERYIDVAARYKLNVFHWHLTDDQAWRLQLTRYPRLGAGAPRYTAADVRRVVEYARRRYVSIVPEIEMPAHAGAALRAYPEIACGDTTLCARGASLRFVRNVIADTAAMFPGPFFHTGGDEVPWFAATGQPEFTREVTRAVEAAHRRPIVWDDAHAGQLGRDAVVMVWTQRRHAAELLRAGRDVVVTSAPLYFDAVQGDPAQEPLGTKHMSTLEQVYADPIAPDGLHGTATSHLLGAQANLWTEHVATEERLFTMLLPRELALAEAVWTPRERKSWPSFLARLPVQLAWLEARGYRFRIPNVTFALSGARAAFEQVPGRVQSVRVRTAAPRLRVTLSVPLTGAVIRYTADGTVPTPASRRYTGPFVVAPHARPLRVRAVAFFRGRSGSVTESIVVRTAGAAPRGAAASWSALVSP
ncbi:MAG TPA: family 20 glycosylhydrolase [Candidatus Elarobacter sp.]|jgi:hexosaminidase